MESLWELVYLLEPAPVTLILTAIAVTFASATRALNYGKEMERNRDLSEASITLDSCLCISSVLLLITILVSWLVSGHWILNNLLERIFGENVMVSVATQQASNPVHTVANGLSLPGLQLITKKLELPVKIVFPRNMLGSAIPGNSGSDYMMLGLGDMAIPSMLVALVLFFDNRQSKDSMRSTDIQSLKGFKYFWYALSGYAIGLVAALSAGILTHSPQPALLYLVPSTLGPIIVISWMRNELAELWEGTTPNINEKTHIAEV
ncbi:unnamed protein product [Fraxinus pennsylvanica]|uniref:Uncharacterized protein n=1 Tax=Fraxinus pennsylvanica TaxID=56036 RepID=A0AAD1ZJ48_9LAMI|nr:unnamed protein product [Fraxinus pennsylvanica]